MLWEVTSSPSCTEQKELGWLISTTRWWSSWQAAAMRSCVFAWQSGWMCTVSERLSTSWVSHGWPSTDSITDGQKSLRNHPSLSSSKCGSWDWLWLPVFVPPFWWLLEYTAGQGGRLGQKSAPLDSQSLYYVFTWTSFMHGSSPFVLFSFWLHWVFVEALGVICSEAGGILLIVPRPGIERVSSALEGKFLATEPPGKSPWVLYFKSHPFSFLGLSRAELPLVPNLAWWEIRECLVQSLWSISEARVSEAEKERVSQLRLLSSAPKNNRKIGSYGETLEPVERWQPELEGWGG